MKTVLKLMVFLYLSLSMQMLSANLPGAVTSVSITNSDECGLSDYTITFELPNDGNTGNSASNVGAFMSIAFPGGTSTDNVTGANLIFGGNSTPVNNLTLNPGSILFQMPIALPAEATFSIEVLGLNNPPFNATCGNPNVYASGACGDILAFLQNQIPNFPNCYRHLGQPMYTITPIQSQVQNVMVDKPSSLPVTIEQVDEVMLRVQVDVCGSQGSIPTFQNVSIGPNQMPIQNISGARIYYGGSDDQFDINNHQMLDETFFVSSQMILTTNQQLQLGENLLLYRL